MTDLCYKRIEYITAWDLFELFALQSLFGGIAEDDNAV